MILKQHAKRALAVLASAVVTPGAFAVETTRIPATADSQPFMRATIDLASVGYVEEEYFVTGRGNIYEYDAHGTLGVRDADVAYKTRMLVRRPAVAEFNGVVLFEMLNPTPGYDIDFEWHFNRELLVGKGYVWVGLTIKDTAIASLRTWDASRYASLLMPDRGLAYDAYAQVGAALRSASAPDDPLAGYEVEVLIGTGYSQSAAYLTTFSNELHEQALTWDGRHVFDGYLHTGGPGAARQINSADPFVYIDERRYNVVDAPLIRVQSETEVVFFSPSSIEARQDDSDVFRVYEIAGGSHADRKILERTGETAARDFGFPPLPACGQLLSPLAAGPVHRAALANLVRWIKHRTAPPPSRLLELDAEGDVVRDPYGNVVGGVRVPLIEAPLGRFDPVNSGPLPCPLAGSFTPFDEATLEALYPRHGAYVSRVAHSAAENVRAGYLLAEDAQRYVSEAAKSDVGR